MTLAWLALCAAIVLEVAGTTCMKLSQGFTRPVPSVLLFVFYGASLGAFTLALRRFDLSVASAVWSGLGNILVVVVGVTVFGEALTAGRVVSIALIVLGVIGLQLASAARG